MPGFDDIFDQKRRELEKEIAWLQKAFNLAAEEGYDLTGRHQIAVDAVKDASSAHASYMGDGPYKPFDPDFYYPASESDLKSFVVSECKRRGLKQGPKPEPKQEVLAP